MGYRRTVRTLLLDADDTLWENNIYYVRSTARFAELLGAYGIPRDETVAALDACERETIRHLGYGPTSYRASLVKTAIALLRSRDVEVDGDLVRRAMACAAELFDPPTELLPDVAATLHRLYPSSRLVLLTKGEEPVQRAKVQSSGLAPLFDHIAIVPEKDVGTYRHLMRRLALAPEQTWMVGNSPRSDINPAVEAGLGAIHIPHNHTWIAERAQIAQSERVVILERFADLLPYFGIDGDAQMG